MAGTTLYTDVCVVLSTLLVICCWLDSQHTTAVSATFHRRWYGRPPHQHSSKWRWRPSPPGRPPVPGDRVDVAFPDYDGEQPGSQGGTGYPWRDENRPTRPQGQQPQRPQRPGQSPGGRACTPEVEEQTSCMSRCEPTCGNPDVQACPSRFCRPGCHCAPGFIRNEQNGRCIRPWTCP